MSNTNYQFCPHCNTTTSFYHVEWDRWECEECGYTEYDDDDDDEEIY